MATMKDAVSRRVWRMTSDSPLGEFLERVPHDTHAPGTEPRTKFGPSDNAVPPTRSQGVSGPQANPPSGVSTAEQRKCDMPPKATVRAMVLRPAQVENWQSSSFDLLSGLQVRDVSDTIPGRVFEELFKTIPSTVFTKRRY